MPKVANQKIKLLYIADYIIHESDEENGFYIKDIQEYLEGKGIKAEYHSITDDIKLLRDQFGMNIEGGGGKGRPFFLLSRHFPFEDISAIAECVGAAKFLSEKEAKRLNDTLNSKTNRQPIAGNNLRTVNQERFTVLLLFCSVSQEKRSKHQWKLHILLLCS